MIGMWVAGLYELHSSIHALPNRDVNGKLDRQTDDQVSGKPDEKLLIVLAKCPAPYSGHPIDSLWVDDERGCHDHRHHGLKDAPTGWDICLGSMSKDARAKLEEEVKAFGDIKVLEDVPDVPERISEKRF